MSWGKVQVHFYTAAVQYSNAALSLYHTHNRSAVSHRYTPGISDGRPRLPSSSPLQRQESRTCRWLWLAVTQPSLGGGKGLAGVPTRWAARAELYTSWHSCMPSVTGTQPERDEQLTQICQYMLQSLPPLNHNIDSPRETPMTKTALMSPDYCSPALSNLMHRARASHHWHPFLTPISVSLHSSFPWASLTGVSNQLGTTLCCLSTAVMLRSPSGHGRQMQESSSL